MNLREQRERLVKDIKAYLSINNDNPAWKQQYPCALLLLSEAVELLESRSSWVSVKEKLPEDALSVLIFYDGHMSIGSYIKGQWFGIGNTFPIAITHWMKPEPPVDK